MEKKYHIDKEPASFKDVINKAREYGYNGYDGIYQSSIAKEVSKSTREESFLHELLHACTHETKINYSLDEEKEEDFVKRLAASLYQVLTDNKLLK